MSTLLGVMPTEKMTQKNEKEMERFSWKQQSSTRTLKIIYDVDKSNRRLWYQISNYQQHRNLVQEDYTNLRYVFTFYIANQVCKVYVNPETSSRKRCLSSNLRIFWTLCFLRNHQRLTFHHHHRLQWNIVLCQIMLLFKNGENFWHTAPEIIHFTTR